MSQYFKSIICAIIFCATCLAGYVLFQREQLIVNNQAQLAQGQAQNQKAISEIVNFINSQLQSQKNAPTPVMQSNLNK